MLTPTPRRVLILGAAGRDFHNFNTVFRADPGVEVVAFTATQIPGVDDRHYPTELAGPHYPSGIPIRPEADLERLIGELDVDEAVFAYSDVTHEYVMHLASRVLAAGADFTLLGPERTQLSSSKPVIAIMAVRTGAGKSPVSRWLSKGLREKGLRVAVVRHPMPYGDLEFEKVQRFSSEADLIAANCTVEEREEYEPHIAFGNVVFAGVDYEAILAEAEKEADLIIWDGGNNDFSFYRPDLSITVTDSLRPEHLISHHPGETTLRIADIVIVNKVDAAAPGVVDAMVADIARINPTATIVKGASPVTLTDPAAVEGKMVLAIDDGPTITHGGMPYGAGYAAALEAGAAGFIDPRDHAAPGIREVFDAYPHIGMVLPAMGYGKAQLAALADTINASAAEVVVSGTPIDLASLIEIDKPVVRAGYEYVNVGSPTLPELIELFLEGLFQD